MTVEYRPFHPNSKKSALLYERAKEMIPGGVNSNSRFIPPYPPFIERGKGSKVYDVDGNEYIDYLCGYGPLLLGHLPPRVMEAVKEQLEKGVLFGMCHELEVKVAEKIIKHVPCAGMVKFSNTGTEAVLHALRIARAYNGRDKIIKFSGHYHGWDNTVLAQSLYAKARGVPRSAAAETIILPWNDLDALEKEISRHPDEISAVIAEPCMGNGVIPPNEGVLEGIRKITEENNILLIFDEIITGFRLGLGGAQEYYGVIPDMATLGKAFAAGFPVSAVAGKRKIMEPAAVGTPTAVTHAGTFNSNPLCMAAALATIEQLEEQRNEIYPRLFKFGKEIMTSVSESAERLGINLITQGPGPFWSMFFTDLDKIENYEQLAKADAAMHRRFWEESMRRGVLFHPSNEEPEMISAAHTEEDIVFTVKALDQALKAMC